MKPPSLHSVLASIPDPQARLAHLIQWSKQQPQLHPTSRLDSHLIPGCLAKLWWVPSFQSGLCQFQTDSDSALVKGLALLLAHRFSGRAPSDILSDTSDPLDEAGLKRHLTANRRDGLGKVHALIRSFASDHLA